MFLKAGQLILRAERVSGADMGIRAIGGRTTTGLALRAIFVFGIMVTGFLLLSPSTAEAVKNTRGICGKCHPNTKTFSARKVVHAPVKKGQCTACHNPHASKLSNLLAYSTTDLCSTCHDNSRLVKGRFVHKPVQEGKCLKCHDPHSTNNRGLLRKAGSQICFECHPKDEITNKKYVHPEVKKGRCLTCHSAHASKRAGLLLKDRKELCVTCHSTKDKTLNSVHGGISVKNTDCVSCHSPHASDNPGIIKSGTHKPFVDKKCSTCHIAGSTEVKGRGISLCVKCHKGVITSFGKRYNHLTPGSADNMCSNCHTPHASDEKFLIKGKAQRVCYACHAAAKRFSMESEFVHSNLDKCLACHVGHGSDERYFPPGGRQYVLNGELSRNAGQVHASGWRGCYRPPFQVIYELLHVPQSNGLFR